MIMASISRTEVKQLLERLIFVDDRPQDWVEDVWGMSPTLGETAARLVDAFDAVIECCSEEKLENLLQSLYSDRLDGDI
ncbi:MULTISPECIES: hypothetical protein [Oscillatoriales]|jgi:hypothetical protein|uniref:Uncharacterized protein n=1 Tax=Limnospira platensis NIES-46 TaxID=1236695 RepID=A0A5M3T6L7_LIMPL|nr:hypothetical protein [Arthrospira platensis]MDF2211076.1 hypothetical protein [Arthrospira platensis NCB002]MDT9182661.1 hypothetical protein [Limnospira sp. PMC 289.06]MDT9294757.1 hypothetical protein [Arthrospira platensis PCC 7345]BAI88877.1 hypothetical protein NIES39_C00070 [Arthrospira platensis NIES-39]BDT11285.1 hypothetical protein N39L_10080 [Arthrospira platensis NIES-39]